MTGLDPAAEAPAPPLGPSRIDALDIARGVALAAMAIYHFSWDLSFLGFIATDIVGEPGWKWFAHIVAGSFLVLVGASLVLGHGKGVRWRPFLRRLAVIAAAAAAITVATYFTFPDSFIFFGILHCIALSSVLTLPFLRLPLGFVAFAAVLVVAAPWFLRSDAFNGLALAWLGLGNEVPLTNDYVPIFPWFGMVLAGVAAGRVLVPWARRGVLARWRAEQPPWRALAWAGRHSLLIYLLHQPLLLGVLYPIAQLVRPEASAEAAPFLRRCEAQCGAGGLSADICRRACACTVEELESHELWTRVTRDQLTELERQQAASLARQCLARSP
jgi:uncharacterized membrane protein